MRGRLIFAFLAELHRLDTHATATVDPDGVGPLEGVDLEGFPVRVFGAIGAGAGRFGPAHPWDALATGTRRNAALWTGAVAQA